MSKVFKLNPFLKETVWGGKKLFSYGKDNQKENIGESWEMSFIDGKESSISTGETLNIAFPKEKWGRACREFDTFPVLTKFIDADSNLSLQVHPDDEYARKTGYPYGKCEMWYIMEAEENSGIFVGLKEKTDKESFKRAIENGTVESLLNFQKVNTGEVYFIKPGTVHAIGKGVLLCEIQQSSDITYRIYDYMRKDKNGNLRELHIKDALNVATLDVYKTEKPNLQSNVIGKCKYFETSKYALLGSEMHFDVDENSYLHIICVGGGGEVDGISMRAGDSFFVPAESGDIVVSPKNRCEILTVKTPHTN